MCVKNVIRTWFNFIYECTSLSLSPIATIALSILSDTLTKIIVYLMCVFQLSEDNSSIDSIEKFSQKILLKR